MQRPRDKSECDLLEELNFLRASGKDGMWRRLRRDGASVVGRGYLVDLLNHV